MSTCSHYELSEEHNNLRYNNFLVREWRGHTFLLNGKASFFSSAPFFFKHILIIPGKSDEVIVLNNTKIYVLKAPFFPFQQSYRILFRPFTIRKILRKEDPSIIEVGSLYFIPWICFWASRKKKVKIVTYFHSHIVNSYISPLFQRFGISCQRFANRIAWKYLSYLHKKFAHVFIASSFLEQELHSHQIKNTSVVPLGVDHSVFFPEQQQQQQQQRPHHLLFVGRLSKEKGVDFLLKSLDDIFAHNNCKLTLLGSGPLRKKFEHAQKRYPSLVYLSSVENKTKLLELYQKADVFLVPGTTETFGLATLEAMACRTAVVAPKETTSELFTLEGAGASYEINSSRDLAEKIQTILAEKEKYKEAAYQASQKFSWEKTFEKIISTYQSLEQKT